MPVIDGFSPVGTTKSLSVSGATNRVALPVLAAMPRTVRVLNDLAEKVFIEFGVSDVNAVTTTSLPLGAGAVEFFEIGPAVTHMAAVSASGSGTVYVTEGQGS